MGSRIISLSPRPLMKLVERRQHPEPPSSTVIVLSSLMYTFANLPVSNLGFLGHLKNPMLYPYAIGEGDWGTHFVFALFHGPPRKYVFCPIATRGVSLRSHAAADFRRQGFFARPVFKRSEEAGRRIRPVDRATSILSRAIPRNATLRYARTPLVPVRERASAALHPPPSRPRSESTPDSLRDDKGKGKGVRALSDWLANYRRRRNESHRESHPLHRDPPG